MPACDFTLWIRDRLLENDAGSVRGLLAYISIESGAWWSVLASFFTWRVPGFDGVQEAELRAAMLLCYRMGFAKEMRSKFAALLVSRCGNGGMGGVRGV